MPSKEEELMNEEQCEERETWTRNLSLGVGLSLGQEWTPLDSPRLPSSISIRAVSTLLCPSPRSGLGKELDCLSNFISSGTDSPP